MEQNRITKHPILKVEQKEEITFYWNNLPLKGYRNEMIATALIANGIKIFGHHPKDNSAQGIFCANGQCAKCTVIANGVPVKSCMTELKENMFIQSVEGLPKLPEVTDKINFSDIEEIETDVLIIGGGPAGLSAAIQIGKHSIKTIIADDKQALGGKLVLQTHKFFGSVEDSYAGTRGIEIAKKLAEEVSALPSVDIWLKSTVLHVFKDKKVGILKNGTYKLVKPKVILNAAGAREKFLRFKGNTLAGIYGAGAFQTLANRDLVKPAEKLFIVGGGNVGLIAGYHALQAGISVVGVVEALPQCGGYKVHADKLKRLGVPIYTSHTILSANGKESVESVTIAQIDKNFKPIAGTEKTFECDTVLIAVGLESVSEFTLEAQLAGMKVFSAGDAKEIAEASSAMFNGKIAGLKIAKEFYLELEEIPQSWFQKAEILKSPPGKTVKKNNEFENVDVRPIINCVQEIPCNPCCTVCPLNSIKIIGDPIMGIPKFSGKCIGCMKCVLICPGLAITLVDYRKDNENPIITLPYEISNHNVAKGDVVTCVDFDGNFVGNYPVMQVIDNPKGKTQLVKIQVPKEVATSIVSFRIQEHKPEKENPIKVEDVIPDDAMVCLCERVTVGEIRKLIREGITDMNQIKAITRAGMGACGYKTCENLMKQIFREEGIPLQEVTLNTRRPLYVEVPLEKFAAGGKDEK